MDKEWEIPRHEGTNGTSSADLAPLVRRAQAGDSAAVARLVEHHQPALLRFCGRLVGAGSAAQDLAQETLLRALPAIRRLEEPSRFAAWLFGIAANLARQWWRQRARWPLSLETLAAAYPDVPWRAALAPAGSPEQAVEDAEQARRLQAAIDSLPAPLGRVLLLHYLDGLSYAEIAAALDVPISTVKGRLFKSRTKLRRHLEAIGVLPPQQAGRATKRTKGGPEEMGRTTGEQDRQLVPVKVDSIRVNVEGPTPENVLRWLHQLPFSKTGPGGERPDLSALARQLAPTLEEAGLRLPARFARAVFLKEVDGPRVLPIVIGPPEADAIAAHLQGFQSPRPLSHDLMRSLLEANGIRVERVTITRWEAESTTFFASITLRRPRGRAVELDARPSDALNLAIRTTAPIFVVEDVMERTSLVAGKDAERESGVTEGAGRLGL